MRFPPYLLPGLDRNHLPVSCRLSLVWTMISITSQSNHRLAFELEILKTRYVRHPSADQSLSPSKIGNLKPTRYEFFLHISAFFTSQPIVNH